MRVFLTHPFINTLILRLKYKKPTIVYKALPKYENIPKNKKRLSINFVTSVFLKKLTEVIFSLCRGSRPLLLSLHGTSQLSLQGF